MQFYFPTLYLFSQYHLPIFIDRARICKKCDEGSRRSKGQRDTTGTALLTKKNQGSFYDHNVLEFNTVPQI